MENPKFGSLTAGLSSSVPLSSLIDSGSTPPRAAAASELPLTWLPPIAESPLRMDLDGLRAEPSLLEERWNTQSSTSPYATMNTEAEA